MPDSRLPTPDSRFPIPDSRFPAVLTEISATINRLAARLWDRDGKDSVELLVGPIRGELYGPEQLADHARRLAARQEVKAVSRARLRMPLLDRLEETRGILVDARERLSEAVAAEDDVGPAGEWLLDNFYVIQEHLLEVRESMPREYYRELPELSGGPLAGYPRVYELAIELIAHTEGRIDVDNVDLFVSAFQSEVALSLGELWALPAMLRLGLIESVRRMTLRTVERLDEVQTAYRYASEILSAAGENREALSRTLAHFVTQPPPLTAIFVSHFLQRIRRSQETFTPLVWLEQWIAEDALSGDEATMRATQRLALTQLMMANSITSLRAVARTDWKMFVERQSVVESVLREGDPAGVYEQMTFETRDRYRHVVESVARRTGETEKAVADAAVSLATAAARSVAQPGRSAHLGYYLVDAGREQLERLTGYRPGILESVSRGILRHAHVSFFGALIVATVAALAFILWLAGADVRFAWVAVILTLIPASEIGVSLVNQLVTVWISPRMLPRRDFGGEKGVPSDFRTAVVVPTLFANIDDVNDALEHLEVQFLANRTTHLHFAILSDFADSPAERREGDDEVLAAAESGINALNSKYAGGAQDLFYLFHRPRRWNDRQGKWMGWERKRGKLAEFNHFLRGNAAGAFSTIVGDVETIRRARYVITLDSDTILPPDAAAKLIGTLAHPLNHAVYDSALGRVVAGYGILQPRVGVILPSAHRSRFAAIHSGHPGVDPYTTAVSDVYQDLCGEGSFTGKGIYEVDAFEQATHGRFPENTLLSHDLIEGNYARAGLVTDVEVYDEYPRHYLTYTRRKHRWIRGDWQLLRWLTSRVPGPDGLEPNRLSPLSRWKILDNLRRGLIEISYVALFIAGWTVLPGSPLRWTLVTLAAMGAPWIISLFVAVLRVPRDKSWRAYYSAVGRDTVTSLKQFLVALAFLPHQAWTAADAIIRTLWRLAVSQRSLLEWQTAMQVERSTSQTSRSAWRAMLPGVALSVTALLVVFVSGFTLSALPLILLWIMSPEVAHALSEPAARRERRMPATLRASAMRYALLHWRFFDRFIGEKTNWLVPDNFQEEPSPVTAMRTSPTNIGLQLLCTVSAYDLGFISVARMIDRLELAMRGMERMRRFRGHFYNWYDLRDLTVLEPGYISTVDSGNLAGHLIAFRQACLAILGGPAFDDRSNRALQSALSLAHERLLEREDSPLSDDANRRAALELAAERVCVARDHLRNGEPGPALELVSAELAAALDVLQSHGIQTQDAAADWVAWCADLTEQHRSMLGEYKAMGNGGNEAALASRHIKLPSILDLAAHSTTASEWAARLDALAQRAYDFALEMDFRFLFSERRKLFAIGYQAKSHTLDGSSYDLLASEARLASFVAIAKKDVQVEHWFRLGRALTHATGGTTLVSWSGSLFEYLMPLLVMRSFPHTLLDQTYESAVQRHMSYAAEHDVPWGMSESAYNFRDRHGTYQYRAFGVPDLALKRGLAQQLVVAPYASAMAVMVAPHESLANLDAMTRLGALGPYGFRDAIDYTRPEPGDRFAVVSTYMAHHIGMALVALTNALTGHRWQNRFHSDPIVRSTELLLHERIPRSLVLQEPQLDGSGDVLPEVEREQPAVREIDTPHTAQPKVALLGHVPYTIMITGGGSGYSRYENLAVTRWRADGTCDDTGQYCYVRDLGTGRVWSAAHQPTGVPADEYSALLATDRVTFRRHDGDIETSYEVAVVPEDAAEVRRLTIINNADETREIEVSSYGEIVLANPTADRSHPAFSNLFVETEWHEWCSAITAARRPRSAEEQRIWCAHVADTGRSRIANPTCETDRARFIGRGRTKRNPVALERDGPLSGTTGAVLDPVFAIRTALRLAPGRSASVAFTTLVATSRERLFEMTDRYHDPHAAERALELAWARTQVELRQLNVSPAEAAVFQDIAGHLFFAEPGVRAPASELLNDRTSQALLWAQSISGDWPILIAEIASAPGLSTVRQLLGAHQYWRRRGMMVDMVLLNTSPGSYLQELSDEIARTVLSSSESGLMDKPGGIFVRRADVMPPAELLMLRATARVQVLCDGCSLGEWLSGSRLKSLSEIKRRKDVLAGDGAVRVTMAGSRSLTERAIDSPGEIGRMDASGDYVIECTGDQLPPAPWSNVVANSRAGFLVTERGGGCTWTDSSYFFRLTPWHNDPVSDPPGDVLYIRDERSGNVWSATPSPVRNSAHYTVRHSAGMTTFQHSQWDIECTLSMGMPETDPVKISILRLTNRSGVARRLSMTAYAEWTLGALREHTQHQVQTQFSADLNAILARNFFEPRFAGHVAFLAVSAPITGYTADRREFLGRNGGLHAPSAMRRDKLSAATGAGLDPCAALRCVIDLAPGETKEVAVLLGAVDGEHAARDVIWRYRDPQLAIAAITQSCDKWRRRLSTISVSTPEPSFDSMINRWLLYQALACRIWGRTALYQSSGAYGFRDQLQDVMGVIYCEPGIARAQIIRAASRQFLEGDVQHWWHPHSGHGIRTRFADDLVWLPFVVDHYVRVTGDELVLDEEVSFLSMRQLEPGEQEVYDLPVVSSESGSVYEHCLRALRRACTKGVHGLPLFGCGDWNDGMNRVGVEGRGESVWMAWFLIATLRAFAEHCDARGDSTTAAELRKQADDYAAAADEHAWDGAWYRRAYFDDGTPLGSAESDECRIDSIAQSWSVISGAGRPERRIEAMRSLETHLVDQEARVISLLTPPFDRTAHDPGYIKGYLPGVRENGAQYTHAALWAVLATAMLGDGDRAFELFQMINPLTHADTPEKVATYKVEPYVVAADVYTASGHTGRGGWTWYTGSAAWMYRVGVEALLGFTKRANSLMMDPRIPRHWPSYKIEYRHGESTYAVEVQNPDRISRGSIEIIVDGARIDGTSIALVDDGASHQVTVVMRTAIEH
ncbi:MAG: GH36-type glycosyl hydrolase domain-containing protein [Gemmatimonadaceae bacterium]